MAALVIDENGCEGTDNIIIRVNKVRNVLIPNAISPNFDGINDKFVIYTGVGVAAINKVAIYDRWGERVYFKGLFEANTNTDVWDGTHRGELMNDQVLFYVVEVLFTDGEVEIFKGDLTLMR